MNLISLNDLCAMWEKDAQIDKTNPGEEILNIPRLHSKYVKQIAAHSFSLSLKELQLVELKKKKIDYYSGRMSKEDLEKNKWEPYKFILKADVGSYVEADTDVIEFKKKMINSRECIALCERICKELTSRTFQLQNFIKWEIFIAGQ